MAATFPKPPYLTTMGSSLERGGWDSRDVPHYGKPTHDFETGRTRACAQHSGGCRRVPAQRAFRLSFCQNDEHLQEYVLELAALPGIESKARLHAIEVQQALAGAFCAGSGAGGAACPIPRLIRPHAQLHGWFEGHHRDGCSAPLKVGQEPVMFRRLVDGAGCIGRGRFGVGCCS